MKDNYETSLGFPTYIDYEIRRLLPTIRLFLFFGCVMLLGFTVIDYKIQPESLIQILLIRLVATVPLILLMIVSYKKPIQRLVPLLILPLGIISLLSYLYLHTLVSGKIYYVAIAWTYFLLVVITIASFYTKLQIIIVVFVGIALSYFVLWFFIEDKVYITHLFIHTLGSFIFTIIIALKVRRNEIDNYNYARIIHQQTLFDYLTQVYNRKGFSVWQNSNIKNHKHMHECCVIMLDIDDFKKINDKYGHQIGDEVIKTTASILKRYSISRSCVVRFGGEEFLVINPKQSKQDCIDLAEQIRQEIAKHKFNYSGSEFHVTTSIGIAHSIEVLHSVDSLINTADRNLYKAKHGGKNQVVWV
jgi:diguanylate cyclase (GGDEF)-like protein